MAVALDIKLDGEAAKLAERLASFGQGVITGALAEIGESVRTMTVDSFEQQRSPEGESWQQSQRAQDNGGKTLLDTATLQNSIDYSMGDGSVTVGSNLVYAAIHQLGGPAGRNHSVTLPARPFLPDVEGDILRTEVMEIVEDHIRRAFL